jgi:hypothetical protein
MRRNWTTFHFWVWHPPVSIVVDVTLLHKRKPIILIGNLLAALHGGRLDDEPFVTMETCGSVWPSVTDGNL